MIPGLGIYGKVYIKYDIKVNIRAGIGLNENLTFFKVISF